MKNTKFQKFFLQYQQVIFYLLIFLTFFAFIISIQVYVNRLNIEKAEEEKKILTQEKLAEYYYVKNFKIPFLQSQYGKKFLYHENNILDSKEILIQFVSFNLEKKQKNNNNNTGNKIVENKNKPINERIKFYKSKLN